MSFFTFSIPFKISVGKCKNLFLKSGFFLHKLIFSFNMLSTLSLHDFLKIVKLEIDFFDTIKGDSDTLAGLVLELHGNIPKIGTVCKVPPFTIIVESADLRKIKRLKVTLDEN